MADQLIQIVDENDQPIKGAAIIEAQTSGLYHRIVRIMVEDEQDNVLLQKRTANPGTTYPNCWDTSAAGHVDEGESYEVAAARELHEEIGIDAELQEIERYTTNTQYKDKILNRFNRTYKAVVRSNMVFVLQKEEVSEVRWFSVAELKKLVEGSPEAVTDGVLDTINRYYQ